MIHCPNKIIIRLVRVLFGTASPASSLILFILVNTVKATCMIIIIVVRFNVLAIQVRSLSGIH